MADIYKANPVEAADDRGEQGFDLKKYIAIARRRWMMAVPLGVLIAGLVFAAAFFRTPTYTSTALVLIDPRQDRVVDAQQVFAGVTPDASAIESEIEIIRSEVLAERVTDRLGLVDSPVWNGRLRERTAYEAIMSGLTAPIRMVQQGLAGLRPNPTADQGLPLDAAGADFSSDARQSVVRGVAGSVRAQRRRLSYVLEISVTSIDARQSAIVANAFAEAYLDSQLDARYEAARRANEWLSLRVDDLREEVRVKESAVEAYRAETGLIEAGGALLTDQQATDLQASILNARADLAEREARLRQVRDLLGRGGSIESVASVINSPAVADLRRQELEVARRQTDLESRYFDQHPDVQNVRLERADIQRQIQSEVDRVVQNLENEVEVARSRLGTLQTSANQIRSEMLSSNRALVRLRELERDAQAARAVLENFLGRFQEIADQESLPTSDARIISRPVPAMIPTSPTLRGALMAALLLGGLVMVGVAVLLEMLDEVVRSSEDISERTGAPVLAVTPAVTAKNLKDLPRTERSPAHFVVNKPMSAFAESLRMLRSAVTYSNLDRAPKVIAVTSASAGEGKTTMSLSLARVSADAGQKVLVIDCDLRRHSLSDTLAETPAHGVLDVLAGTPLEQAIVRDQTDRIDVLPAKAAAFTPADVFGSDAMGRLLDTARERYDLVICDCAPVLAVAETRILARRADACIMVARWARTPAKALRAALRELRQTGVTPAGVVLNSVSAAGARGDYYGTLYYSKAYQNYYSNA